MALPKINLNPEQQKAVDTINGPLLIIAGAGSGKTGVITCRIANMLSQGIPQASILALTFTNKAAAEMAERVKSLTGKKMSNLTVATFHAFGARVLRKDIDVMGYRPNFSIYDTSDKISCIKEAAAELRLPLDSSESNNLVNLFSAIKTGRQEWDSANEPYRALYNEYEEMKKLFNAVDFDDLITMPIDMFTQYPEVLERYQERFQYILLDEFQDTSAIQYKLINMIARSHGNLCCVGDDDQSIYSWRGANYANIVQFETDYPKVMEIKLERNYRSNGTILEAANSVIANNTNRKEKALWTDEGKGDRSIQLFFPQDDANEADFILDTIRMMKGRDGLNYGDFGILVRTNGLMKTIENAMLVGHIPYNLSGGESFFQRKEVKDMIAYMRMMINPTDDVSLLRVINTPRRGLGKKALQLITSLAREEGISLYSACCDLVHLGGEPTKRIRADLAGFIDLVETFSERFRSKRKDKAMVLIDLVEELDMWGTLLTEYGGNEKIAKWRYDNIKLLGEFLGRWENDPDNLNPSLTRWLNSITLSSKDDGESDKEKVNLMTIHASKGLEFNVVFLAGVEQGILPHERALEEGPEHVEEERRLFYVAITRARRNLFITSCATRKKLGEFNSALPSIFLEEIPDELIDHVDLDVEPEDKDVEDAFANLPWKK